MVLGISGVIRCFLCLSTVRFSIFINSTSCGFFQSTRGLRQGDSLSLLLFVLVMEALSGLIDRAIAGGFFEGFSVTNLHNTALKVSHLVFTDDTLIICSADRDQLLHLKGVLLCIEAVSGLCINLDKSEIVPVGSVPKVHALA